MYSKKAQQEFYRLIEIEKNKIRCLKISEKISEDEKHKLYVLVDETIRRFEKNRMSYLNNQVNLARMEEEGKDLNKNFEILNTNRKILLFNLENIIEISSHPRYKGHLH